MQAKIEKERNTWWLLQVIKRIILQNKQDTQTFPILHSEILPPYFEKQDDIAHTLQNKKIIKLTPRHTRTVVKGGLTLENFQFYTITPLQPHFDKLYKKYENKFTLENNKIYFFDTKFKNEVNKEKFSKTIDIIIQKYEIKYHTVRAKDLSATHIDTLKITTKEFQKNNIDEKELKIFIGILGVIMNFTPDLYEENESKVLKITFNPTLPAKTMIYFLAEFKEELNKDIEPTIITAKNKLEKGKIKFDKENSKIIYDKKICKLGYDNKEYKLCRVMFNKKIGKPILWNIIHTEMYKEDSRDNSSDYHSLCDTVRRINNRINHFFNTNDKLFLIKDKYITINF